MKKALVILLALTMVVSMFAVAPMSASAAEELTAGQVAADYKPEGEAVKTAEEFLNMKADGTYYLANDITLDETYYDSFTGTFDGNGKTITTSVTIFDNLDGTVKNLIIAGSITIEAALLGTIGDNVTGALAHFAAVNANATIDNVCNNAPLTSYACGMAGMVGRGSDSSEYTLTIKNCVNNGNITTNCATTSNYDSGGMVASFRGVKANPEAQLIIENCVNNGTINADGRPGGIVGNTDTSTTIINCTNNGDVQAIYNYCGGIAARFGADDYKDAKFYVENCVNNGRLSQSCSKLNPDGKNPYKTAQIGGMSGYNGNSAQLYFKNCINNGEIVAECKLSPANLGGMMGANKADIKVVIFENCVNNANITGEGLVGKNIQCGGMAGIVYASEKLEYINCVNNGDIYASVASGTTYARAAGLCSNNQLKNGGNTEKKVGYCLVTGCINNGDLTVENFGSNPGSANNNAGGMFAYCLGGVWYGAKIEYCANYGDITGPSMVSGLIGYINSNHSIIRYNVVAGKLTNTTAPTTVKTGDKVAAQVQYTFNHNGTDYYFYAPLAGVVTINGADVTVDALENLVINDAPAAGTKLTKDALYYTDDSKTYAYRAGQAGALGEVSMDDMNVVVGNSKYSIFEVAKVTGVNVYDHEIGTRSLVWSNANNFYIDPTANAVEIGTGDIDYVMGCTDKIWAVITSDNGAVKYTKAQFASGEVAYALNQMIGETKFYQNLIPSIFVVDQYPTPDATHAKVFSPSAGNYTNQLFEMNADVTPPTGDATVYVVIALAVATVSLAALAVVKKRKEN